ncbi:hypothetical protein KFL_001150120 [Klebsormidium nitens]|uniref:Fe2OG dioxygenase domain-containing protein n=1 Tax=Klebsormidium nitens TaxID=105231 RepID=A0A1Y1I053_KLENI|nr:hypothetical protein KFL_001150120 [Klebsormidium nitens]|eukprot:GAQ82551.1 hypothetical protein KFL_001150120 [Klebsormidium nitens]
MRHRWRTQAGVAAETAASVAEPTTEEATVSGDDQGEEDVGSGGDPEHLIIEDEFLDSAEELREHFDSRFAEPRQIRMDRFVWDYWHVPNQYTLIRTPAEDFFPRTLYESLEDALLSYGENKLGCRSISPVWLSYYVDGCSQELHADNPHGPWAFVLSLTDWERRRFSGGETMILQPHVLDYWRGFEARRGMELEDLVTQVEPDFNRLTVFDPRLPHGVRPVRGTQDPREARLVLHGWFTEPTPFFTGALEEHEAVASLNAALEPLFEEVATFSPSTGTTTVRLTISGSTGAVTDLEWLTDTLIEVPGGDEPGAVRDQVQRTIVRHLGGATFPTSDKGDTYLTMPFVFD